MKISYERLSVVSKFVIDAGGTHTRLRVHPAGSSSVEFRTGSINPASGFRWKENLGFVVEALARAADGSSVVGIVGSSAISPSTLDRQVGVWCEALAALHVPVRLTVVNDVVPLVAQPGDGNAQLGVVLGTGSCFLLQHNGSYRRLGGMEWLGSDEGGASHLGMLTLRSLAQGLDGRREWSAFHEAVLAEAGETSGGAFIRRISEDPHPKAEVARLAPVALRSAFESGDANALSVVDAALSEVANYIDHLAGHLAGVVTCRLAGGLLQSPGYLHSVMSIIKDRIPLCAVHVVSDGLDLAETADHELAAQADGYAWSLSIPEGTVT